MKGKITALVAGILLGTAATATAITATRTTGFGVTCGPTTKVMVCKPTVGGSWGATMTAGGGATLIPLSNGANRDGIAVFFKPRKVMVFDYANDKILLNVSQP